MATNQQGFPQVNHPIIYSADGTVTQPWYQFFRSLWVRTGGGSGSMITTVNTGTGLTGGPADAAHPVTTFTLAPIANNRILANYSGSPAIPVENTIQTALDSIGAVQGDVLYRNASTWVVLAPGTSGYFLQTAGGGANPSWQPGNAGTVTNVATGSGLTGGPITTTGTISLSPTKAVLVGLTNSTQTINNGSETTVSWDTAIYNEGSWWSSGTDVTVPSGVSRVQIQAGLKVGGTPTVFSLYVDKNGSQNATGLPQATIGALASECLTIAGACAVTSGDVLTLRCNLTGAGLTMGQYQTFLGVEAIFA